MFHKGISRIGASLSGRAFAPHRHDAYAISLTLGGIQAFDYRGVSRSSAPGQVVVLYPDELHDGRAGTDDAFTFRTLYIQPPIISAILGNAPLPFVKEGVSSCSALLAAVRVVLDDLSEPLEGLELEDALYNIAVALCACDQRPQKVETANLRAVHRAKSFLDANIAGTVSLQDIELAAGHDRYALTRDFRRFFGTSPYRYLVMRRIENACAMLLAGATIAAAAAEAGFADQSHFTRHFKKAYGLTPARWRTIVQDARG